MKHDLTAQVVFSLEPVCSCTNSFADSMTCSAPATVCCATSLATRVTLWATDFARFVTPDAARDTALRLGSESLRPLLRADAPRFVPLLREVAPRFADDLRADDLRADDLRADDLRADDLRAGPFRAGPLRADLFLAAPLRAGPLMPREPDLREADPRDEAFLPPERVPAFFPPLEPPRDDFLAAAMITSSDIGVLCASIATSAHKLQQFCPK